MPYKFEGIAKWLGIDYRSYVSIATLGNLVENRCGVEVVSLDRAENGVGCLSDQFKTSQWLSNQNQPLNWLVKGFELCWQDAFYGRVVIVLESFAVD
jgi:hypothetical protein